MLLTNFDFYDIYWSVILMRTDGFTKLDYTIAKAIKDTIAIKQEDNVVESNIIRNTLSEIEELKGLNQWQWVFTKNIYTYGTKFIKDDISYQILSVIFDELLSCLIEPNEDRIHDLKDAMHNIPIILAERDKYVKKLIAREISSYRKKWNKLFLKSIIK